MRKLTMEFEPGILFKTYQKGLLDRIESFRLIHLLRVDFEEGVKVMVAEMKLKNGVEMQSIKWPLSVQTTILSRNGDQYIVLFYAKAPEGILKDMFRGSRMDVIWTDPTFWKDGRMLLSCMGEENELKRAVKIMKLFGSVRRISFSQATFQEKDLISRLTQKQREILFEAKKSGYYNYPRKVKAEDLASRLGVSKATAIEHLRKAECRLISSLIDEHY
ncbi:MAG: helix-turn-helix domain-containing protein [Candidatus Thermoplasmatota archaeon]|nr:helix-turn-helix domain-containing protein [Candidatus Thermoplasmatota archaeon]